MKIYCNILINAENDYRGLNTRSFLRLFVLLVLCKRSLLLIIPCWHSPWAQIKMEWDPCVDSMGEMYCNVSSGSSQKEKFSLVLQTATRMWKQRKNQERHSEAQQNISPDIVSWSWVFCLLRSISIKFLSYNMPQSIGWEPISVLIQDFNCRAKAQFTDREYLWSHSQKYNISLMFYF